jgi:hypothetical protein
MGCSFLETKILFFKEFILKKDPLHPEMVKNKKNIKKSK